MKRVTRTRRRGTPADLDLRLQLAQMRHQLADANATAQRYAGELMVAEHRRVELHVAYVELLVHARAEVAEARQGRCHSGILAGHLEEIGLLPPEDKTPEQIVAEGLALTVQIGGDPA